MTWMCSADAHIDEPGDTWASRLPKALLDEASSSQAIGMLTSTASIMPVANDGIPASDDIPGRLRALDEDGIWAETIIGNRAGLVVLSVEDPDVAIACARAYNDYLVDTFGPHRDREIGVAFIPVRDIDDAVAEIKRAVELGLRGITLPLTPPEPYSLEKYDPIWSLAAESGVPVSFHATTGGDLSKKFSAEAMAAFSGGTDTRSRAARKTLGSVQFGNDSFQVLGSLVGAGVLDQHPDLQIVFVETNASWLVSAMAAMDATWTPIPGDSRLNNIFGGDPNREDASPLEYLLGGRWPFELRPSEYVHRQVHATFQDEAAAIELREFIGIGQLLWGSDFPHPEGTWPHSKKIVEELFTGVPQAEKDAVVGGNMAKLYGIAVPA